MVMPIVAAWPDVMDLSTHLGSPPSELNPRLKIIKVCLILIMASTVLRVVAGTALSKFELPVSYLSIGAKVVVSIVGSFLLKDDQAIAPIHRCLVRVCCSFCEGQCQGGMSCLSLWFTFCATITITFGCFPTEGSDVFESWHAVQQLCGLREERAQIEGDWLFYIAWTSWLVASSVAFFSQVIGAYQGFQGLREMQSRLEADALDAQAEHVQLGQGVNVALARQHAASGGLGGPPPQGFTPFSGVGRRIGK